jgi:hypothetical protein
MPITRRTRAILGLTLTGVTLAGGAALWKHQGRRPSAQATTAGAASRATVPPRLDRLFQEMEAVGPDRPGKYDQELRAFLTSTADPLATLEEVYAALPPDAAVDRWKTAFAAREIPTAASVRFLEKLAVRPAEVVPARPSTGRHARGGVTDRSFHVRATATTGVVKHYLQGVEGAEAAVARLLATAEPEMAQTAAVELFTHGRLSDEHRAALTARNMNANYRLVEGAELDELTALKPDQQEQKDLPPPAKGQ